MFETAEQIPSTSQTVPNAPSGRGKPIFAALLSLLIPGLGQAYNRQWQRTLLYVAGTLLLELLFIRTRVWTTLLGLLVGLAVLLLWRLCAVADAAAQARKRLRDPARHGPVAAVLASLAIIALGWLIEFSPGLDLRASFRAFRVPSGSMCPTLCEGDRMIADVKAFRSRSPQRGEVVMFLYDQEAVLHVKRVIAVGGDQVSNSEGKILVNGFPIEVPRLACGVQNETPANFQLAGDVRDLRVPPNHVFLVGDNLDNSFDSRFYGAVEVSQLRYKPLYLYWSSDHKRIGCAIR